MHCWQLFETGIYQPLVTTRRAPTTATTLRPTVRLHRPSPLQQQMETTSAPITCALALTQSPSQRSTSSLANMVLSYFPNMVFGSLKNFAGTAVGRYVAGEMKTDGISKSAPKLLHLGENSYVLFFCTSGMTMPHDNYLSLMENELRNLPISASDIFVAVAACTNEYYELRLVISATFEIKPDGPDMRLDIFITDAKYFVYLARKNHEKDPSKYPFMGMFTALNKHGYSGIITSSQFDKAVMRLYNCMSELYQKLIQAAKVIHGLKGIEIETPTGDRMNIITYVTNVNT